MWRIQIPSSDYKGEVGAKVLQFNGDGEETALLIEWTAKEGAEFGDVGGDPVDQGEEFFAHSGQTV